MEIADKRHQLNKIQYSVRTSQAVLQYGVGAMVDFPDQTLMTAAPEYWKDSITKINDERLEKALKVDYFGMPHRSDGNAQGISYVRFPEWYFCPKCRSFKPISEWIKEFQRVGNTKWREDDPYMIKHMQCPKCKQGLVISRLVTVCECGHIDDFPWVKWVHVRNFSGSKPVCQSPSLVFKTGNSANEGLETLRVECKTCGASATLKDAFDPKIFEILSKSTDNNETFKCQGKHPWKHTVDKSCPAYPQTKQRGSSSVYFPISVSSLVIPPYSSILNRKIEQNPEYEKGRDRIVDLQRSLEMAGLTKEIIEVSKERLIKEISESISVSVDEKPDQIESILRRRWLDSQTNEEMNFTKYKFEEYSALSGEVTLSKKDSGEFIREETDIKDYHNSNAFGINCLKSISLIKKVREVQALIGYSRLKPIERNVFFNNSENFVSIKDSNTKWYPAYEVRGEGIFIEIDNTKIEKWLQLTDEPEKRAKLLEQRYNSSYFGKQNPRRITAKFVLLHTISHHLIKELSFSCGYSIAALKERIYCSEEYDGKVMSGIFIYTASGDSEGTLGGLVRQGRADLFPKVFEKAIESARVCSNDPVCSLSNGQGRDSLNLSACYSCSLIPETSCEEFNAFLDRGLLIGTYKNNKLGFFENNYDVSESEINDLATESEPQTILLLNDDYTNWLDETYEEIWKSLPRDLEKEEQLIDSLLTYSFESKEKPIGFGTFSLTGNIKKLQYDFAWIKSKVMLFSSDNSEDYKMARNSDWKCFYLGDEKLSAKIILNALEEK